MVLLETNVGEYAIIINDRNEFLLVQWGEVYNYKWHFPGGRLDKGETEIEGLKREIEEELGCKLKNIKPVYTKNIDERYYTTPNDKSRYAVFYLAELKGEINLNKEELNSYKWFKKTDLNEIDFWLPFYKEMLEKVLPF